MKTTRTKLIDIATVAAGSAAPKKDLFSSEGAPFIRASSLAFLATGKSIEKCEKIDKHVAKNNKLRLFPKHSVIFAKSGMSAKTGRVYELPTDAYVASHLAVLRADNSKVIPSFLRYYFTYRPPFNLIRDDAYPSIKLSDIERIEVDLPEFSTQLKIVSILDRARLILAKRQECIELVDGLLKSTFLTMFGKKNPSFDTWENVEVQTLAKSGNGRMRTGPFGSSLKHEEFEEEGDVAVLGIDNAVHNVFKWGKKRFLTVKQYADFKQFSIYPRDVIITIMGTVGRSAVIPDDIATAISTKHLAAITLDERKCNPYYLAYSIHSNPFVADQIKTRSRGAIMDGLNLRLIRKIRLKAAPVSLQNRFEEIFLKNKRFRQILENSNIELDNLLNSLLQRVFNGQLNFNIEIELKALIHEIDLFKQNNDLSKIVGDIAYLQMLIDKLNDQEFEEMDLYDKAKHGVFQLMAMKEGDRRIVHKYDEKTMSLSLAIE